MSRSTGKTARRLLGLGLGLGAAAGGALWLRSRLAHNGAQLLTRPARSTEISTPPEVTETMEMIESVIGDDEPATPIAAALHETLDANKATPETPDTAQAKTADAEGDFVGNIKTLVYHNADSARLPAEENRQYFHSEAEAQQAGFRRAENE